jgi:hypothetical protein
LPIELARSRSCRWPSGRVDVLTGVGGPDGSKGRIATDAGATPGAGR